MSYYETLGLSKNASQDEIKKAYRKLANKYHPDKPSGDENQFKKVKEAYETLSDLQKKKSYDTYGSTDGTSARYHTHRTWTSDEVDDILRNTGFGGFGDIFGRGFGKRPNGFSMGPDGPEQKVNVPLEMMFNGGTLKTQVMKQRNIDPRYNTISITSEEHDLIIPANVRVGQKLTLDIEGVKHTFIVNPSPQGNYVVSGLDIAQAVEVDAFSHIAGFPQNINHPAGKKIRVKIPHNLKNGQIISLKGEGLTSLNGFKGDFLLEVRLIIPDLSSDDRKKIGDFLRKNTERYKS